MASLIERAIGAARLDVATYEDVEADPNALGQAMSVVALAAVSTGIGTSLAGGEGVSLVLGVLLNLLGWFVWALVAYLVGTRILPTPETQADLGQLLRTTGFSAAPGILGILGAVPVLGGLVLLVLRLWQLASMVIAVRQALDYTSTGRAVGVCLIGFLAYMLVVFVLVGIVVGGVTTLGGVPAPAAPLP